MRPTSLRVPCPYCTARSVVDCGPSRFPNDRATRLKGTDIDCTRCGNEFELYYY